MSAPANTPEEAPALLVRDHEIAGHLHCAQAAKGLERRPEKAWHLDQVRALLRLVPAAAPEDGGQRTEDGGRRGAR